LKDVQKEQSIYPLSIEVVGIKDISYPVKILRKDNNFQSTVAQFSIGVELPSNVRGTHMSRFIEIIERHKHNINGETVKDILKDVRKTFDANKAFIKLVFPYFIEKRSPVSRNSSILEYKCGYHLTIKNNHIVTNLIVTVPVTTLCPCSKEISEYGAHNQRAYVTIELVVKDFIWFEDIIDIVEQSASAPIYPLLKREDEKYVTEQAYNNPKFVEDVVREVYTKLRQKFKEKVGRIKVIAESEESIHNHRAFAVIDKEG